MNLKIVDRITSFISNEFTIIKTNDFTYNDIEINTKISLGLFLLVILYLFYNIN